MSGVAPPVELAEEFRLMPFGHHSEALQALLLRFRDEPLEGRLVAICLTPYREWVVGVWPGRRGGPMQLLRETVFSSREAVEWEIFRIRWKKHFGRDLPRQGGIS